jgi:N utilization substance protein B
VSGNKQKTSLVNRRYLRVKVFQALYSYFRTEGADLQKIERQLFDSVNELNDLYLHLVALIIEMESVSREILESNRRKQLPSPEDLKPNMRFVENRVFKILKESEELAMILERANISWSEEHDDLRRAFKQFRTEDAFILYMTREDNNIQTDKAIIEVLFKEKLGLNDVIHASLEEKNIFWRDDLPYAALGLIKTIQGVSEDQKVGIGFLADLYKNKKEDQSFAKELLRKTVDFSDEYGEIVAAKSDNWETERIALLDMLLMKMALTELEHFPTVPVKVTLNEYIELAKIYSTPKSKYFINGVLDKLVAEFKESKRIDKRGRGLIE